jgi:hypothetical protein
MIEITKASRVGIFQVRQSDGKDTLCTACGNTNHRPTYRPLCPSCGMTKWCTRCEQSQPRAAFKKKGGLGAGLHDQCQDCRTNEIKIKKAKG